MLPPLPPFIRFWIDKPITKETFTYRIDHHFTEGAWYGTSPANNSYVCHVYNQKSLHKDGPISVGAGDSPQQAYKNAIKKIVNKSI